MYSNLRSHANDLINRKNGLGTFMDIKTVNFKSWSDE